MDETYLHPKQFARQLRKEQSNAEGYLWSFLRGRRFCGFKFRRQRPIGPFVVDFCCMEAMLVIELDGGQHKTAEAMDYDETRTEFLKLTGFKVLRFWDNEVFSNTAGVLERIRSNLTVDGKGNTDSL